MKIEFKDWRPDAPDLFPFLETVNGVYPAVEGFVGAPDRQDIAATSLGATCVGVFSAVKGSGTATNFVATDTDLFTLTSATTANVSSTSGAYSVPEGSFWEFAQFNDVVIAAPGSAATSGGGVALQEFTLGSSASFASIAGAPHANTIAVVKDFLVVGNTYDTTDGAKANRVRWSGIGDYSSWTVNPTTQADYNDLPRGAVQNISGGEYGVVITDCGVWRMSYVGSPLVFQFDEVLPEVGTAHPGSVAQKENLVFMFANDGARLIINGAETRQVGKGKVDEEIKTEFGASPRLKSFADPLATRFYIGSAGPEGSMFVYDYALDRWSKIGSVGFFEYAGVTRDLASSGSVDFFLSRYSASDGPGIMHYFPLSDWTTFQLGSIRTRYLELSEGRRTMVTRVRPLISGMTETPNIAISGVNELAESGGATNFTDTADSNTGTFTARADARYHRFQVNGRGDKFYGIQIETALARGFR